MSLKQRFLVLTLVFLTLMGGLQVFIELQMREVKETRHRIEEDWREMRLLVSMLSDLSHVHARIDIEGESVNFREIQTTLSTLASRCIKLEALAGRNLAGIESEKNELRAVKMLEDSIQRWRDLVGEAAKGGLSEEELAARADVLYAESSGAIFSFTTGSLEEMDHSLDALNASEDRFQDATRFLNLGMACVLGLGWFGFSLWLLRPIARLQTMVRQVRARDFNLGDIPHGPDEIGDLLHSFMDMAVAIGSFTQELERKVAERTAELESSRRRLRQMLDDLPDAVALVDGASQVMIANAVWRLMFGEGTRSPVGAIEKMGLGPEGYYVWEDGDGGRHLLALQRRKLGGDELASQTVTLEHVRDMTEHVRTQEALASSQKLASIGRLSAGLAHEINNPLTAIAACAEGLIKRSKAGLRDEETFEEYLRTIHDEVFRCKEITEKLLDFSRHKENQIRSCHVGELAADVVRLTNPLASRGGVTVRCSSVEDDETFSDATALRQIMLNLVLNAIEASHQGGNVDVAVEGDEASLFVRVRDDGAGIEAADLPKLFEPFFSRRRDGTGTGLGLFVCQGLAQALGGEIAAESTGPGQGAVFSLRIPRRETVPAEEAGAVRAGDTA